ncbi:IPExxxVDY family protein [Maribacter algicola]|uniref:IPExxxVDY family protein n=1 Tax=Maribacter algicola TaxID=2498892 RepID=A0A426RML7_9FLAO|nr:IPExxxVDY family protein [Maribacter algicola]RRQ50172.1 IPExxxVDY family protein [Maribacter algicola]
MSAVYKIKDDYFDDSFLLVALHSSLEDYAIAYGLNSVLRAKFKRSRADFDLSDSRCFPYYEWEDEYNYRYWVLVSNHSSKQELVNNNDLFQYETTYSRPRLIPELKEVDYFLKIEEDEETMDADTIIKTLLGNPKIMAAYEVDVNKLKSRNNLIF